MVRSRQVVGYATAWIPVALLFSLALAATDIVPLQHALVVGVFCTLPALLLGVIVLMLCHRFPWHQARIALFIPLHLVAGVGYSALWSLAIVLEIRMSASAADSAGFLREGLAWQLVMGLLTYAVIAGIAYARAAVRHEQEQIRAAERAETLRLAAELNALRARLDPHFLFNVLQTIGALVDDRPADTHMALEHLAGLLKRRLVASRDLRDQFAEGADDSSSLAEELEDVREYCALEKLRLGSRLNVVEEIDASTLASRLPRFTLQPLVENAIRHGLALRASPGHLTLRSTSNATSWTLVVSDDGVGGDLARANSSTGLGLATVRERLRLRYENPNTFAIATAPQQGFTVTLTFPIDEDASGATRALRSA